MYQPDHIRFSLFSNDEYGTSVLGKSNLYLQSENTYDEAKTKLKELRPEFINEDIFKSNLTKNYDNIWLSNIIYFLEEDELNQVTDKFSHNLNDDGQLMIGYLYNVSKYNADKLNDSLKLLKDYSPFFHSFTSISELEYNNDNCKDIVLIYQKKK